MKRKSLTSLAMNTALLGWESQMVIGMRIAKLALGGPAASKEANLMVAEKIGALQEASIKLAFGASPNSVVRGYRAKVRANRKRLAK